MQGRFPMGFAHLKGDRLKSHIDRNRKLTRQTCWKELI